MRFTRVIPAFPRYSILARPGVDDSRLTRVKYGDERGVACERKWGAMVGVGGGRVNECNRL